MTTALPRQSRIFVLLIFCALGFSFAHANIDWSIVEDGSSLPTANSFWHSIDGDESLVQAGLADETPSGDNVYLSINDNTRNDKLKIQNSTWLNGSGSTARVVLRLREGVDYNAYGIQTRESFGEMKATFRKTRNGKLGYVSFNDGRDEIAVNDITSWHVYWIVHAPNNRIYVWVDPDPGHNTLEHADLIAIGAATTGNTLSWGTEKSDQLAHYDIDEIRWARGVHPPGKDTAPIFVTPPPPPPETNRSFPFTVMSYNVGAGAGVPFGTDEVYQIANEIKSAGADLVGMQEVEIGTNWKDYRNLVAEIDDALQDIGYPMEHYWVQTFSARWREGMICLVIWSRFPILETEQQVTSRTFDGDTKMARVEIEPAPGLRLNFFTHHYWTGAGHDYESMSHNSIKFMRQFDGPLILAGDFNFPSSSHHYAYYTNAGFFDPCALLGGSDCLTIGDAGGIVAPDRLHQIDFIFATSHLEPAWVGAGPTTMSDHWPLIADFDLPYFLSSSDDWRLFE